MRKKAPVPLSQRFPHIDPLALRLLERLVAFDPKERVSAEQVSFTKGDTWVHAPYQLSFTKGNTWVHAPCNWCTTDTVQ